jgi:hypothetical protein
MVRNETWNGDWNRGIGALSLLFRTAVRPATRECGSASTCFFWLLRCKRIARFAVAAGTLCAVALPRVPGFCVRLVWRFQNSSCVLVEAHETARRFGLRGALPASMRAVSLYRHTKFRLLRPLISAIHERTQRELLGREFCAYACSRCHIWRL